MRSRMPLRYPCPVSYSPDTGPLAGTEELVTVEADSDPQRVLERFIQAVDKQRFRIIRQENE